MNAFFRPAQRHQHMVCFDDGADRFQIRAGGIALRNGRVLVQNVSGDPVSTIPGGRIDQNEASGEALVREYQEEFGLDVTLGPLAFVIESFFPEKSSAFHEIGFYYPILAPEQLPYHDFEICHRFREGSVEIEYRWVEVTPKALGAVLLMPPALRTQLAAMPETTLHLTDDRRP